MKKWKNKGFSQSHFWRLNLIFIFLILSGVTIIGRLIHIQLLNHQYWQALAQGQQKFFTSFQGERGEIFFQDGTPLAINRNFDLVYLAPNEIKKEKKAETAYILSQILEGVDEESILEKTKKDSLYELIKKKLSEEELASLKELEMPGIYLGSEPGRYYPFETMASQVIGFLGGDNKGQYGIEGFYDEELQGEQGFLEKEKGPAGFLVSWFSPQIEKGSDIFLTLDYNIQFRAEKLLEETAENLKVEAGQIIVLEPASGKVLALANYPNFNPNYYSEVDNLEIFQNGAIQKIFEPGSAFKPITMAAALDQEKITPQTSYTDPGLIEIGGWPIYNYEQRIYPGRITMTEVLEKSINTGAVFAEEQVGHQAFQDYINRFGIFQPTGIDLQGEIFSQNREFKKGYEINFATASFGQGIEMTAIQLARAFSAIANGGSLVKPYLVEKISQDGKIKKTEPEIQSSLVISPKTASQLTAMLVRVVENGFGRGARIPGYYIAGKTGTAQIAFSALGIDKPGYSEKTVQSFVGFAPAFDPQFLILIKLDNPQTKTAEYSAVPIFQKLAKYIIDYWQIPPDYQ